MVTTDSDYRDGSVNPPAPHSWNCGQFLTTEFEAIINEARVPDRVFLCMELWIMFEER